MLTHMMFIMCTNEEFTEFHGVLVNDGITLTRHILDAEGNETDVVHENVSREEFVNTVNKGINSLLELTIKTPNGNQTISRPFFPVTLIDVPMVQKAGITLDCVPDFLPQFNEGKLGFILRGELMDFAQQDIDEGNQEDT
jgi:hypothetical protein